MTAQSGNLEELRASVLRLQMMASGNISLVPQERPQVGPGAAPKRASAFVGLFVGGDGGKG